MGCAVQVHVSPNRRLTWAEHALDGCWYLKTSHEHYRCHNDFIKKTRSERILDTVFFQHRYITNPTVTHKDKVVKALGDVQQALLNKKNSRSKKQMEALKQLDDIFGTPTKKKVTFSNNHAPEHDAEPRVIATVPRVDEAQVLPITQKPRVATAVIDKPLQTGPACNTRSQKQMKIRETIQALVSRRTNREEPQQQN